MALLVFKYFLWVLPIAVLTLLLLRLAVQSRLREQPLFASYALAVILSSLLQFGLYFSHLSYIRYFISYWACQTTLILLSYAAIYEVVQQLLSNYEEISPMAQNVIFAGTTLLLLVVCAWALNWNAQLVPTVLTLQQACRLLQVGVLALIFAMAIFFHLRWQQNAFGIAFGFGMYGTIGLLDLALRRWNAIGAEGFSRVDTIAYNCITVVWLVYLFSPERQPVARVLPTLPIEEWNEALGELLHR